MDTQTLNSFAQELRRRQRNIIAQVAHTQEEIGYLSAELESEWSDSAVEEDTKHLLSRLEVVGDTTPEEDLPDSGRVPPDLSLLSDEELQDVIYDQVRDDGRVEMEELQVTCRNSVVMLNGALPSEREHSILRQLITDVLGFELVTPPALNRPVLSTDTTPLSLMPQYS